ncbi:protein quick-to-court isoform X2 [Bacillus rossius redtenbacheri]|uniref:protein quick-to-court isoform X2 n=1 Tax=Bacillus rossius redtenbacheri TaxID=93214 RepID=UPI002FDD589F
MSTTDFTRHKRRGRIEAPRSSSDRPMANGREQSTGTMSTTSSGADGRRRSAGELAADSSRIPVPRRSASLRLRGEGEGGAPSSRPSWQRRPLAVRRSLSLGSCLARSTPESHPATPTPSPEDPRHLLLSIDEDDDDLDSLRSFGSACSAMSCDHAYFARNGTTFSGRRMKYVVHCSSHAGGAEEYLTPTQRANRQIRKLKVLLKQAHKDLEKKDQDIFQLTKEVVELRLFKASLAVTTDGMSPATLAKTAQDEHLPDSQNDSNSLPNQLPGGFLDDSSRQELKVHTPDSEHTEKSSASDVPSSLEDSGHFEDLASSAASYKESLRVPRSAGFSSDLLTPDGVNQSEERARLVNLYEKGMEKMQMNHMLQYQETVEKHNEKVEKLLQKLSDGATSYSELRKEHDRAQERIWELEREAETMKATIKEQEERHKSMYLRMYMKGQEAARFEHADQVLEFAHQAPSRVSVPELLQQLENTKSELENMKDQDGRQSDKHLPSLLSAKEAVSLWLLGTRKAMYRRIVESRASKGDIDPEITLQFLKSAVYYFLTDRENHLGHLNAIESILGYTDSEKLNIDKMYKAFIRK